MGRACPSRPFSDSCLTAASRMITSLALARARASRRACDPARLQPDEVIAELVSAARPPKGRKAVHGAPCAARVCGSAPASRSAFALSAPAAGACSSRTSTAVPSIGCAHNPPHLTPYLLRDASYRDLRNGNPNPTIHHIQREAVWDSLHYLNFDNKL